MIFYWDSVDFIWGVSRNLPLLQPWGEWGPLAGERQWAIRVESGYDPEDLGLKSVCLTLSSCSPLPNAFLLFILKEYFSEHKYVLGLASDVSWSLLGNCEMEIKCLFSGDNCIQTWLNHSDFIMFPSLSPTLRLKRSKLTRTLIPKGNAQPPTEYNFLQLLLPSALWHLLTQKQWTLDFRPVQIQIWTWVDTLENSAKFMSLAKAFWGQVIGVLCYHCISYRRVWQVHCRMEIIAWPAHASECDHRCAVVTSHHNVIFTLYSNLDMPPLLESKGR